MITNYGIYNHHELDNTLLILFSDEKVLTHKKISNEMEVLIHEDKVVGYRIINFIRYAKIKYSGIIFLPAKPLIDIINQILNKYNLETIDYKYQSGYITKMNGNKMMVFALEGTFLRNMSISKGEYVTYFDLYIENDSPNSLIVIDENIKENIDFFQMEEK